MDADPANHPTHVAAIPPLPYAVTFTLWDTIMMIHFIEHIPLWKARELLADCHRLLKAGGVLILEQPDITYCAKVLLGLETPPHGAPGQFDLWGFYGDPTHENEFMLHRWGFTPQSLSELLVSVGFAWEGVTVKPAQFHQPVRDFRVEARKA